MRFPALLLLLLAVSAGAAVGCHSDSLAGVHGATYKLLMGAGDNQTAPAGTAVLIAPRVTVTTQEGSPVTGVSIVFSAATGGGSVTGATQTTGPVGVAVVGGWTLGATPGANTLVAIATANSIFTEINASVTFHATGTAVRGR